MNRKGKLKWFHIQDIMLKLDSLYSSTVTMILPFTSLVVTFVVTFGAGETRKERLTVDGRPFTINQKDFKPAKFTMFGHEFDDTYGFVSPDFLPLDNRGYTEVMEKCDLEANTMPLYQYSKYGTMNYYPDTQAYDNWKGYDLVPENQHNYVAGGDYALNMNFKDGKRLLYDKTITMQTCRIPQEDGGAWHVQRVGPIVSTGGYDWWQLGFPDAGLLAEVLQKHPEGVDVNKFIFVPVYKNGTRIGYPPIHTHHVHVTTQNGVRPRLKMRPMCVHKLGLGIDLLDKLVAETLCYNSSMYFEQHGDYICQPEDDGLDCLTQGDKNPRRISEPIDLEGELNDVRPRGSEPMEWYYQFAVRWSPADMTKDPVSQAVLLGPGLIVPPSQLSKAFTYPAPTHAQNVMISTSHMLWAGELVRLKAHSHASVLEGVMMLRGLPVDFGLGGSEFIPPLPSTALITTELGFRDNEDLAQHILYHMKLSQEAYDRDCVGNKKNLRNPVCLRPRPDWMCGALSDEAVAVFAGVEYTFDRRPKMFCKPWAFKVGEEYTAVQFNRRVTKPPTAAYPGTIPASIRQHLSFILSYDHTGLKVSHGDLVVVGHDGPFYDFHQKLSPPMFMARLVAVVLWSGPPLFASTLYELEWLFVAIFTAIAASLVYLAIWCMRKSPAIDKIFNNMQAQVTMVANSVVNTVGGAGKAKHSYEMVSLTEEDDGAELQDERAL